LNRQDTALGTKKDLVIVGGGIIGLSTAYFALEKGWNVTVVERNAPHGDNCSQGNSGMIVPSHFVPLAAPGIMGQAIRWMRDPESPFSLKPSLSLDMLKWGLRFYLASTRAQVDQAAPILRDLNLASRDLYIRWSETGIDSGLAKKGLLMLCKTGIWGYLLKYWMLKRQRLSIQTLP
jgi:D-amino-acid dehydrogenase